PPSYDDIITEIWPPHVIPRAWPPRFPLAPDGIDTLTGNIEDPGHPKPLWFEHTQPPPSGLILPRPQTQWPSEPPVTNPLDRKEQTRMEYALDKTYKNTVVRI